MSAAKKKDKKTSVIQAAGGLVWRESAEGPQIVVVHRPRYDDWSFPKGLVNKGESWDTAALREVREETGCKARLGDFAGCNCYQVNGQPKVVVYWQMSLLKENAYRLHKEVDRFVWLPPREALERLSYQNERSLLRTVLDKFNVDGEEKPG